MKQKILLALLLLLLQLLFNFSTLHCNEAVLSSCPSNCKCSKARVRVVQLPIRETFKLKCGGGESKISSIQELDLKSASLNIVQLDLSDNTIAQLSFESFSHTPVLQKLNLSKNQIYSIESEAFVNLTNLRRLDLSYNHLSTIGSSVFTGLENLEKLKLNQNGLTRVREGTFDDVISLKQLDLSGNPLHCDCELSWLLEWAQNQSVKLMPPPMCGSPVELRGQPLRKLRVEQDLICSWPPVLMGDATHLLELKPAHNQVVFEGDPLRLRCRASGVIGDSSSTKMTWLWGDQEASMAFGEIRVDNRYLSDIGLMESALSISHLSQGHSGQWHCHLSLGQTNHTRAIRVIVISEETKYCPQIETHNNKGHYSWPKTVVGFTVELQCEGVQLQVPEPSPLRAQHTCTEDGQWDALNTSSCPFISEITKKLEQFAKVNWSLTKGTVLESAKRLKGIVADGKQLQDKMDVIFIAKTVENYLPFVTKEKELGPLLVDVVSTMMNLPKELMTSAQIEDKACSRLVQAVETVAEHTSSMQSHKSNLAVEVNRVKRETFAGLSCTWFVHSSKLTGRWFHCSTSNATMSFGGAKVIEASIDIPASLFYQLEMQGISTASPQQLLVSMYENNQLFPKVVADDKDITSCIIGTKLVGLEVHNLTEPVYVKFRTPVIHHLSDSPKPVWWDAQLANGLGGWNQDGCSLSQFLHGLLVFQCNRLGYFGLLQKIGPLYHPSGRLSGAKFRFSHPAIYIGSFCNVACLVIAVITYVICHSSIQMSKKAKHSLTNTWISIALLCFMFSAGINQTEDMKICQGVGLVLHYLTLSSLLWMAVTVSNMYKKLSKSDILDSVPEDELPSDQPVTHKPLLGLYLVGWGIALIVCGISGAVNMREYAGHWHCFLTPGPALSAVFVPAGILVVFLSVFFLLIRCSIRNLDPNGQLSEGTQLTENVDLDMLDSNNSNTAAAERTSLHSISTPTASSEVEDPEHSPLTQLKAHIIVLVLYILMWAAAAIATVKPLQDSFLYEETVFSIIYGFVSASLGAFVVFFYCIARSDVRSQWHLMQCWCKKRRGRCCRTRSISDTNPPLPTVSPVTQATNIAPPRMGTGAVSSSNSVNSSSHTNKSHNSNAAKAAVELNGMVQTLVKSDMDSGGKKSNVNLVVLHRQMYRSNNSVTTFTEPSGASGAEMFYNPHQSTVARKFFRKQRRHMKHNNLGTRRCGDGGGTLSDCDSTTRAESAVFLSSDMENTSGNLPPNILGDSGDEGASATRRGPPMERLVIGAEETTGPVLYQQAHDPSLNRRTSIIGPVEEVSEEVTSMAAEVSEIESDLQLGLATESGGDLSEHEIGYSGSLSCRTSNGALNTSFETQNFKTEDQQCSWEENSEINSDMTGLDNCSFKSIEISMKCSTSGMDSDRAYDCSIISPSKDEDEDRKLPNPQMKHASRSPRSRHKKSLVEEMKVPPCPYINGSVVKTSETLASGRDVDGCTSDDSLAIDKQPVNKKETSV